MNWQILTPENKPDTELRVVAMHKYGNWLVGEFTKNGLFLEETESINYKTIEDITHFCIIEEPADNKDEEIIKIVRRVASFEPEDVNKVFLGIFDAIPRLEKDTSRYDINKVISRAEFNGHKRLTVFDVKMGDKVLIVSLWDGFIYKPRLVEKIVTSIYWDKDVTDWTDYYSLEPIKE